jgi:NAD(P)-dependent dehydrogenase (short-subunit alcohol dehydrogenase family)
MELAGKVAVVTGASSGIGEAAAKALAGEGMTVVAVARRAHRLEALAAATPGVVAHAADVGVDEDVAALAEWVSGELGACHVLVNNAGLTVRPRFAGWEDYAVVSAVMNVNFAGAVRCMAAFADLLFASAPARVINIASVAGKVGVGPPAYTASKFALVGFSEAVGLQWRRKGVTVTQLNPGFVRTEGFPQSDLPGFIVSDPQVVARAIVSAARRGPVERTVPRWYRPFVTLRHLGGSVFWRGAGRAIRGRRGH